MWTSNLEKNNFNKNGLWYILSEQLKPNEQFNYSIYMNQITVKNLWIEYAKYKTVTYSTKWWFKQKYKSFYNIIKISID